MQSRISKLGAIVALVLVAVANGWHLGALQLFAWSSMAYENAEDMAIAAAIEKAVNGSEICGLCAVVIEAEKRADPVTLNILDIAGKLILFVIGARLWLVRANHYSPALETDNASLCHRILDTIWQPPKSVLAI